jgi:uncharacterized protein (DUF305 family)
MRYWSWAIIAVCALAGACRSEQPNGHLDVASADSVVWGEDRRIQAAQASRAAGPADRAFLERLLNHYQGLDYLADRMRRDGAVSAVRRDAWRFDTREDAEKRRAAGLLLRLYRERYMPVVPREFKAAADSLAHLARERQPRAVLELLAEHQRHDLALIEAALPALEDPDVRELALELRRDQTRDLAIFAHRLARE